MLQETVIEAEELLLRTLEHHNPAQVESFRIKYDELSLVLKENEQKLSEAEISLAPFNELKNWEFQVSRLSDVLQQVCLMMGQESKIKPKQTTKEREVGDVSSELKYQTFLMKEQDSRLEQLENVVVRQKNVAIEMNNELDVQNEMLDTMESQVDNLDTRIQTSNSLTLKILKKLKGGSLFVVLLFVVLFVLILI